MAYPTSEEYKIAIGNSSRETYISGTITTQKGAVIDIDNSMITPGSLYITNQCVDSDAFSYGSVFAAEMGITLKSEIDRYSLYEAKIVLNYNILTKTVMGRKQYETIPLGEFYVNDPARVGKNITIKAYDRMVDLDEELHESFTGDAYEMLSYLSAKFGFRLAQTEAEIRSLINSSMLLTADSDRVGTYRELLSFICKVTCTFASFDRHGELKLYEFSETPTKSVSSKTRTSSKLSDFETHFKGVRANFIYLGSYKEYAYISEFDSGLILDLGAIPIIQGLDSTTTGIISNIYLKLEKVKYIPCDITFNGDPSVELGDLIISTDRDGTEYRSLVTFYKWIYRGNHTLKSAGQNPRLINSKRNESKQIESLRTNVESKELSVHTYTNISEVKFSGDSEQKEVSNISFVSKSATTSVAMVTVAFESDVEGEVEFYQLFDDEVMLGNPTSHHCSKGHNIVSFTNYFTTSVNSVHRYTVKCTTKAIDEAVVPNITIKPYTLKVVVFGQGLSVATVWDGLVRVNETIPLFAISPKKMSVKPLSESVEVRGNSYNPHHVSDKLRVIKINRSVINVIGVSDEVTTIIE